MLFICMLHCIKFVTIVLLLFSLDALFWDTFQRNFLNGKATHFYNGTISIVFTESPLKCSNLTRSLSVRKAVLLDSLPCWVEKDEYIPRVEFSEDWSSSLSLGISSVLSDYGVNLLPIWRNQTIQICGNFQDFPYQPYHNALFGLVIQWPLLDRQHKVWQVIHLHRKLHGNPPQKAAVNPLSLILSPVNFP